MAHTFCDCAAAVSWRALPHVRPHFRVRMEEEIVLEFFIAIAFGEDQFADVDKWQIT